MLDWWWDRSTFVKNNDRKEEGEFHFIVWFLVSNCVACNGYNLVHIGKENSWNRLLPSSLIHFQQCPGIFFELNVYSLEINAIKSDIQSLIVNLSFFTDNIERIRVDPLILEGLNIINAKGREGSLQFFLSLNLYPSFNPSLSISPHLSIIRSFSSAKQNLKNGAYLIL